MPSILDKLGLRTGHVQQTMKQLYFCPVCAFPLDRLPKDFTICPCCDVEFGYTDAGRSHAEIRKEWIQAGAPWMSAEEPPIAWNPWRQLERGGYSYEIPWLHGLDLQSAVMMLNVAHISEERAGVVLQTA